MPRLLRVSLVDGCQALGVGPAAQPNVSMRMPWLVHVVASLQVPALVLRGPRTW